MFKILIYISSFFFILLMLSSCGKDNDSNLLKNNNSLFDIDSADIQRAVKLISPKKISVYENQASAITLFARSKNNITYSISEDDSEHFELNTKSGVITFKIAPDYENKRLYTFRAKAMDNKGNNNIQNIIINILDINEHQSSIHNIKRVFYISKISYDGEIEDDTEEDDPYNPRYNRPRPTPTAPTPQQPTPQQPTPQQPITGQPTPQQPITGQPTNQQPNNNQNIQEEIQEVIDKIYKRDNSKNIVMDNTTNMMWQDNNDVKTIRMTWDEASAYCQNISLGGYSDWRLPTLRELHAIMDNKKSNRSISDVFRNLIARNYWSSTKYAPNHTNAWTTNLYHGNTYGSYKSSTYYVACTRNI